MNRAVWLFGVICIVIGVSGCATAALSPREQELARTYYNLGNTYERLGEYPAAVSAYKRALEIDPLFYGASYNLAVVQCLSGAYEASQTQFRSLLAYDPENTRVLSALAWCLLKDRQAHQALEVYRRIAAVDPGDAENRRHLIYLLLDLEHYDQASDELKDLIEFSGPDPELLYLLYEAEEARDPGSGQQWLEASWERDPEDERTAAALMELALAHDREEQARRIVSALLDAPLTWEQLEGYGDQLVLQILHYASVYVDEAETASLLSQVRDTGRFSEEELASLMPEFMREDEELHEDPGPEERED